MNGTANPAYPDDRQAGSGGSARVPKYHNRAASPSCRMKRGGRGRALAVAVEWCFRVLLLVGVLGAASGAAVADLSPEPLQAVRVSTAQVGPSIDHARPEDAAAGEQFAQASPQPAAGDAGPQSVGIVSSLQGSATVVRNGARAPLKVQDEIFKGDVLQTGPGAKLGIIFDDETTFSLTANASMAVDDFVYEEGGGSNLARFKFVQGTVAFVAHAVAKTGDMTLSTPTATMGIRGTTGLVNVGAGGTTAGADAIKLYPDADGKVGRIEVRGRDGTALGVLTRPATGLSLQRGAGTGARVVATPLQISPQEAARDQHLVRQVHAERQQGQALVAQRRAARPRGATPRNGQPAGPKPKTPAARPPAPAPAPKPPATAPSQKPPAAAAPVQKPPAALPASPPVQKPPALRRSPPPRPVMPPRGKPPPKSKQRH